MIGDSNGNTYEDAVDHALDRPVTFEEKAEPTKKAIASGEMDSQGSNYTKFEAQPIASTMPLEAPRKPAGELKGSVPMLPSGSFQPASLGSVAPSRGMPAEQAIEAPRGHAEIRSDIDERPVAGQQYAMNTRSAFPQMEGLTAEIDAQAAGISRGASIPGPGRATQLSAPRSSPITEEGLSAYRTGITQANREIRDRAMSHVEDTLSQFKNALDVSPTKTVEAAKTAPKITLERYEKGSAREQEVTTWGAYSHGASDNFVFRGDDGKIHGSINLTPSAYKYGQLYTNFARIHEPADKAMANPGNPETATKSFSPGYMLSVLKQLKQEFPDYMEITGGRISGALAKKANNRQTIPLPDIEGLPTREEILAKRNAGEKEPKAQAIAARQMEESHLRQYERLNERATPRRPGAMEDAYEEHHNPRGGAPTQEELHGETRPNPGRFNKGEYSHLSDREMIDWTNNPNNIPMERWPTWNRRSEHEQIPYGYQ